MISMHSGKLLAVMARGSAICTAVGALALAISLIEPASAQNRCNRFGCSDGSHPNYVPCPQDRNQNCYIVSNCSGRFGHRLNCGVHYVPVPPLNLSGTPYDPTRACTSGRFGNPPTCTCLIAGARRPC
jgi:hypothetical protein